MHRPNGEIKSKRCSFRKFPNHPQIQHRKTCDELLMKTVKCAGGKTILYPKMIFTYRSVIVSLQEMLNRPGFFERCETWRSLPQQSRLYNDVYDGKIWDEFKNPNGILFFC